MDSYTPETFDNLISAKVLLPKGDVLVPAKVISRKCDLEGRPIGNMHGNPMLDTWIYNVEFPDGQVKSYSTNANAENIYSQVDSEGNFFMLLSEITNHSMDDTAISIDDKWITQGSNKTLRQTTHGWYLQVTWKDGSSSWEPLCNLCISNPVKVAEYAVAKKLVEQAAFAWWVHSHRRKEIGL
jgi:hypothetical protein